MEESALLLYENGLEEEENCCKANPLTSGWSFFLRATNNWLPINTNSSTSLTNTIVDEILSVCDIQERHQLVTMSHQL